MRHLGILNTLYLGKEEKQAQKNLFVSTVQLLQDHFVYKSRYIKWLVQVARYKTNAAETRHSGPTITCNTMTFKQSKAII